MRISIKKVEGESKDLEDFNKKEWRLSDIEHYGGPRPYKKIKHKFVATNDLGIVGMLELDIEANVAYIEGVLVSSKARGLGIGKSLILFGESFAKGEKCTKIWLDTEEGWGAVKFYKKMGYKLTGTHERHYLNKDGLIFTKFF